MAIKPEAITKKLVKNLLEKHKEHCYYFMPSQGKFATKGVPDFIICFRGNFIAIETKAEGKEKNVTKLQEEMLNEIERCNGYSMVISNQNGVDILERKLEEFLE